MALTYCVVTQPSLEIKSQVQSRQMGHTGWPLHEHEDLPLPDKLGLDN